LVIYAFGIYGFGFTDLGLTDLDLRICPATVGRQGGLTLELHLLKYSLCPTL